MKINKIKELKEYDELSDILWLMPIEAKQPIVHYMCDGFGLIYDYETKEVVGVIVDGLEAMTNEPFLQENSIFSNDGGQQ